MHVAQYKNKDDELAHLRRQNKELKDLVSRAMLKKLDWDDLPKTLQDDRDLMETGKHLTRGEFQAELQVDRDVILGVLKAGDGADEWYNLPKKWKDDAIIACAAFAQCHEREINFDPEDDLYFEIFPDPSIGGRKMGFEDLPYHLCMNKDVLLSALRSIDGPKLSDIPYKFRADLDILETAFLYGRVDWDDIPIEAQLGVRKIAHYGV